ncbi:MAG TPA: hypothetical protein VJN70_13635 [Gemmatimonadaceae bacterium]|nr:hypothetical protein [Gemmatimonadaceae bacterium]
MAFAIVMTDDLGRSWTVEPVLCPKAGSTIALRFARPAFLSPVEQCYTERVPTCWPNCDEGTLRESLRSAAPVSA